MVTLLICEHDLRPGARARAVRCYNDEGDLVLYSELRLARSRTMQFPFQADVSTHLLQNVPVPAYRCCSVLCCGIKGIADAVRHALLSGDLKWQGGPTMMFSYTALLKCCVFS